MFFADFCANNHNLWTNELSSYFYASNSARFKLLQQTLLIYFFKRKFVFATIPHMAPRLASSMCSRIPPPLRTHNNVGCPKAKYDRTCLLLKNKPCVARLASSLCSCKPQAEPTKGDDKSPPHQYTRAFYTWMFLCNLASCGVIASIHTNTLSSFYCVIVETSIALLKWVIEIYYGNFTVKDTDLLAHHLAFFVAASIVTFDVFGLQHYQFLVIHGVVVHIPFLFANAKKVFGEGRRKRVLDACYLALWAPIALYRSLRILYLGFVALCNGHWISATLLVVFSLIFMALDFMWTPWQKYRQKYRSIRKNWCEITRRCRFVGIEATTDIDLLFPKPILSPFQ